jgi:hypothetical protein
MKLDEYKLPPSLYLVVIAAIAISALIGALVK